MNRRNQAVRVGSLIHTGASAGVNKRATAGRGSIRVSRAAVSVATVWDWDWRMGCTVPWSGSPVAVVAKAPEDSLRCASPPHCKTWPNRGSVRWWRSFWSGSPLPLSHPR